MSTMNDLLVEAIRNQDFEELKRLSYLPGFSVLFKGDYDRRLIHYAAECGSVEIVDFLLRRGSPLNVVDANGAYPLHIACANGDIPIVSRLIGGGAFVNRSSDTDGMFPVHIAVSHEHLALIALLVANGANLFQRTAVGDAQTALHMALHNRQDKVVRFLLALGYYGCFVHRRSHNDPTLGSTEEVIQKCCADLLEDAAISTSCTCSINSDYDITYSYSTQAPSSINEDYYLLPRLLDDCDIHGRTPLLVAVERGLPRCVEMFIAIGATPTAIDHRGRGLFHFAALCSPQSDGLIDMLDFLTTSMQVEPVSESQPQQKVDDMFSLLNSADCHIEVIEQSNGYRSADGTDVTDEGSVGQGSVDQTLTSRASPSFSQSEGYPSDSPLLDCEEVSRSESVTYTYTYTISVIANEDVPQQTSTITIDRELLNARDNEGLTPVHYAVLSKNAYALRTFLRNGASFRESYTTYSQSHESPKPVSSALHVAVALPDLESVRILLQFGADPNQADSNGGTSMHRLFSISSPSRRDILIALLEHGAMINVEDSLGFTPFSRFILSCVVQKRVEMDILQTLISAGAKLEPQRSETLASNVRHNSALLWLCTIDAPNAVQLLVDADWDLRNEDWLSVVYDDELHDMLTAKRESVNRLMNLCRMNIRKLLLHCSGDREIVSRVLQLGLPMALKRYLLFQ